MKMLSTNYFLEAKISMCNEQLFSKNKIYSLLKGLKLFFRGQNFDVQ